MPDSVRACFTCGNCLHGTLVFFVHWATKTIKTTCGDPKQRWKHLPRLTNKTQSETFHLISFHISLISAHFIHFSSNISEKRCSRDRSWRCGRTRPCCFPARGCAAPARLTAPEPRRCGGPRANRRSVPPLFCLSGVLHNHDRV